MLTTNCETWGLQDWLTHFESMQPAKFNLRLENVCKVAKKLNVLDLSSKVITVAGTNGKGSTVAALTAIYTTAGYKVGCFTSPHIIRFNERISVNNQQIADDVAAEIFLQIEKTRGDTELHYFELAFLCALVYFQQQSLDLIILEVGMGGRLDATNIIDSDLTIITSIALDHQQYLGDTTLQIGYEKAGIMRPEKVCIFADDKRPLSIDEYAKKNNTRLYSLHDNYTYTHASNSLNIKLGAITANVDVVSIPLPKVHPNSVVAAIIGSQVLNDSLPVTITDVQSSVQNIIIFARQQLICHDKIHFILDVAHNPHAVKSLANYLSKLPSTKQVHAIFSGLAEKDLYGMVSPLLNIVDHWYPTVVQGRRAASKDDIHTVFKNILANENVTCFSTPLQAYNAAVSNYQEGDLIVIYGSFFLIGAIMENFNNETCYV